MRICRGCCSHFRGAVPMALSRFSPSQSPPSSLLCWQPIAFLVVPVVLLGGVFGALTFASQETEDMSPAEVTKKLNRLVPPPPHLAPPQMQGKARWSLPCEILSRAPERLTPPRNPGRQPRGWRGRRSCERRFWRRTSLARLVFLSRPNSPFFIRTLICISSLLLSRKTFQ